MEKHNYKQENVSGISTGMQSSKETLEGSPLSIETMPYSWNTGLINIVIQWFEVMTILGKRDELIRFFDKGDQRLSLVSKLVNDMDSQAATHLDSPLISLQTIIGNIGQISSELATMSTVTESHVWVSDREAEMYYFKDYVIGYNPDTDTYEYNWSRIAALFRGKKLNSSKKVLIMVCIINCLQKMWKI